MNGGAERGFAVVAAALAATLLAALGASLVLTSSTDARIAVNFRESMQARYAADALAERVLQDLADHPDWDAVLDGSARSDLVDGPPGGERTLGPLRVNLTHVRDLARCGRPAGCTEVQMRATSTRRPWGADNPRWQLYAHTPSTALGAPSGGRTAHYVVALVGDDGLERDGDPLRDGPPGEPGAGVLLLRLEAFAMSGARARVDLAVARHPQRPWLRVLSRHYW